MRITVEKYPINGWEYMVYDADVSYHKRPIVRTRTWGDAVKRALDMAGEGGRFFVSPPYLVEEMQLADRRDTPREES